MTLVLEIEHLLGVAFAARTPAGSDPDWPPQPDRVFSALVAAWGARGKRPEERQALEWLEKQSGPELAASGGSARTPATVFVPPNDPQTGRVGNLTVMPTLRRRQPRRFPAYRPDDPIVRLIWRAAAADHGTMTALNALAADTPYIGHSASLTRCRFSAGDCAGGQRRPPAGRFIEVALPNWSASIAPAAGRAPEPTCVPPGSVQRQRLQSVFADRWLVLEHVNGGGEMPDLRAAALVSKALRNALMSGYKQDGRRDANPRDRVRARRGWLPARPSRILPSLPSPFLDRNTRTGGCSALP